MPFWHLDSTARAAWAAATTQTAQLEGLRDEWAGQMSVRYYSPADAHLATVTHETPIVDASTTPYSLRLGAWVAESHVQDGTAAYAILAVPAGADILRCDVSLAGPISDPGGRVRLDIGTTLRVQATAGLPAIDLPAWLPAAGTAADLTTNTVDSAAGRTTAFARSYSGAAFASWWGAYGSMIVGGGGHGDGELNDIYRIDVETRLVTQIKPPATSYLKGSGTWSGYNAYCTNGTIGDASANGWMWANTTPGDMTVQTGEPFAMHWYCIPVCLPESALSGTAPNGWLYTPARHSCPTGGSAGTAQDHALAMGEATTYTAPGAIGTVISGPYPSVYDASRNRVWYQNESSPHATMRYRDLTAGTQHSVAYTGGTNGDNVGYYESGEWDVASDCMVIFGCNSGGIHLAVFDPVTSIRHNPTITNPGDAPAYPARAAYGYSETWRACFYYPGQGGGTFYFLKCDGSDPRTSTWTWSSQTVTGTTLQANDGTNQAYNRLRHCEALGNVLIWHANDAAATQVINLASAP